MPPPARPPWQPEQLKRTNSCRPSPIAVRSFGVRIRRRTPAGRVGGPGTGPTAVDTGGGAARRRRRCGGVPPARRDDRVSSAPTAIATDRACDRCVIAAALRSARRIRRISAARRRDDRVERVAQRRVVAADAHGDVERERQRRRRRARRRPA